MNAANINEPIDPADVFYDVCLANHHGGGEVLCLNRDELDEYNRNPDLYAARHFGFATADEYREWVNLRGTALCGERTKAGRLCGIAVNQFLDAPNWMEKHRSQPCHVHSRTG